MAGFNNSLARLAGSDFGPMALYEYAKQGMEEGRQRGQQSVLSRLAGEAYSAPQADRGAVFGRMAQVDPNAALQAEQTFAKRDDDRIGQLASKARYLVNMHRAGQTQAVMGLYPQLAQEARALGLGDVPPEWSDSFVPGMEALASYGMSGAGEQFTLSPGSKRFDASGNVLAEVPFAPANAQYVDVPDGQGGSVKMLLDPRTQQFVAPNYGSGGAPQSAPTGGPGVFASLLSSVPGLRVTSQHRTPEENAALPNSVPNSYHLTGQALDIGTPTPEQRQRIGQWAAANGYEVITNYQDGHVHLEPAPGRGARTPQAGGMGYTPPKPQEEPQETFSQPQVVVNPQTGKRELVQFGNRGGRRVVSEYAPEPPKGEGATSDGLNDRQRVAVQGVQRNLIQYASALTGIPLEQLQGMSAQEIAKAVQEKGGRFLQGGVARVMGNFPGGQTAAQVQNSDILSYSQGAGAAWAGYENPTGIITNADRESATAQMPNYLDPPEVQAQKIRSFLELSGWDNRGQQSGTVVPGSGTNAPQSGSPPPQSGTTAPTQAVPPQAIQFLRSNPGLRDQFERKYGVSADQFLR